MAWPGDQNNEHGIECSRQQTPPPTSLHAPGLEVSIHNKNSGSIKEAKVGQDFSTRLVLVLIDISNHEILRPSLMVSLRPRLRS